MRMISIFQKISKSGAMAARAHFLCALMGALVGHLIVSFQGLNLQLSLIEAAATEGGRACRGYFQSPSGIDCRFLQHFLVAHCTAAVSLISCHLLDLTGGGRCFRTCLVARDHQSCVLRAAPHAACFLPFGATPHLQYSVAEASHAAALVSHVAALALHSDTQAASSARHPVLRGRQIFYCRDTFVGYVTKIFVVQAQHSGTKAPFSSRSGALGPYSGAQAPHSLAHPPHLAERPFFSAQQA